MECQSCKSQAGDSGRLNRLTWNAAAGLLEMPAQSFDTARSSASKSEAAFGPAPDDDEKKVESNVGTGAAIGGALGAVGGIIAGGLLGGEAGALAGAAIGGLVGAGIGALIGAVIGGGGIRWKATNYASSAAAGSSTTVEQPFNETYKAIANNSINNWQLKVDLIEGGVDMDVHTGGSRDPIAAAPATQAEASAAVTDMKGYYARGSRGAWHTEAASRAHAEHHYREWKCSAEHYWAAAKMAY